MPREPHQSGPRSGRERGSSWRRGGLTGAAVSAGWLLSDLAVFGARGAFEPARQLVPDGVVAVGLGGLAGALLSGPRRLGLALLLAGLLAAASLAVRLPVPAGGVVALRVVCVWVAGLVAARLLAGRSQRVVLAGTGLGLLVAVAQISLRYGISEQGWRLLWSAGGLLLARFLAPLPARAGLVLLALVWSFLPSLGAWEHMHTLRRPDLPGPPPVAVADGAPSLLLVVLDTVRADHLGSYGYQVRATTPRLDAFAAEHATRYTQARSTSSWTLPSHASLFTGLLPAEHGATHPRAGGDDETLDPAWPAQPLRSDVPTLAERLRARGYDTAAIMANPLYLRHEFRLDRGFAHYDDRDPPTVPHYLALPQLFGRKPWLGNLGYRDARAITDLALEWCERRATAGPFFLALNYMDAHMPYLPPAPFDRAFDGPRPETPLAAPEELHELLYDRELAYLDHEVGRLLDGLAARGLLGDLAVVITSDHGEAFGEHGTWKHDWTLHEEVVHVPLLVKAPGASAPAPAGAINAHPISGAEVHDLMLALTGQAPEPRDPSVTLEWYRVEQAEAWEQRFGGLDFDRDLVAWLEGAVKVIVSSAGDVQAFDLGADPGERHPLAWDEARRVAARERAAAWWRAHPPLELKTGALNSETLERMRALGYLDDGGLDADGQQEPR